MIVRLRRRACVLVSWISIYVLVQSHWCTSPETCEWRTRCKQDKCRLCLVAWCLFVYTHMYIYILDKLQGYIHIYIYISTYIYARVLPELLFSDLGQLEHASQDTAKLRLRVKIPAPVQSLHKQTIRNIRIHSYGVCYHSTCILPTFLTERLSA